MGCEGWEISAHAASAPDHEPIQGLQYSDAEYTALNNSLVRRIGTLAATPPFPSSWASADLSTRQRSWSGFGRKMLPASTIRASITPAMKPRRCSAVWKALSAPSAGKYWWTRLPEAMKTEFLQNLKIGDASMPKEVIDAIMAENGRDIEAAKKPFTDYDTVKQQLTDANKAIEGFKYR